MPQMSSMDWFMLSIYFLIIYLIFMVFIYYMFSNLIKDKLNILNLKNNYILEW